MENQWFNMEIFYIQVQNIFILKKVRLLKFMKMLQN